MFENLLEKIKAIHFDNNSIRHFIICLIPALIFGLYGVCIVLSASITKEWCGFKNNNYWCWADLSYDLAGMFAGFILNLILF